jgi:hypothetical protein
MPFQAPYTFLEQLYRKEMTLDKFTEFDFDCIFRGLRIERRAYYSVFPLLSKVDARVSRHVTSIFNTRHHDLSWCHSLGSQ